MLARLLRAAPEHGVRSVARSHVGRVRAINEDRTLDHADRMLWAVADGMGGHFGGDVAADTAVAELRRLAGGKTAISVPAIRAALDRANGAIHARGRAAHGVCGATAVVATLHGDALHVLWAGDSRAYLIRGSKARQLTVDHTLVQEMVEAGTLSVEDARRHPNANIVTRALGVAATVKVEETVVEVLSGDRILLCSDGLSASLEANDFAAAWTSLDAEADALVSRALARDGSDNISLVLIAI